VEARRQASIVISFAKLDLDLARQLPQRRMNPLIRGPLILRKIGVAVTTTTEPDEFNVTRRNLDRLWAVWRLDGETEFFQLGFDGLFSA
jgi:hypothetical protein